MSFEGRVRDRNQGRKVRMLQYEAYKEMAEQEGERIMAEACAKFPILAALCVHRVGRLLPGEIAVWSGVVAEHRAAAFDACRYIIDEVKARLPIWKKEHYGHASAEWIGAPAKKLRKLARTARNRKIRSGSDSARVQVSRT